MGLQMPDGKVLMHAGEPYDPNKAHEYYLRTRQLKGRSKNTGVVTPHSKTTSKVVVAKPVHRDSAAIAAKVAVISHKISALRAELDKLLKESRAKRGDKPAAKKTASGHGDSESKSKLTAKQRADAAKASKAYYDKHKKPATGAKKNLSTEEKIKDIRARITKLREQLARIKSHKPVPVGAGTKSNK